MKKRLFVWLLTTMILLTLVPAGVWADEAAPADGAYVYENVKPEDVYAELAADAAESGADEAVETTETTDAEPSQDATEITEAVSGSCGDNLTWTLDDSGILMITGTGDQYDYASESAPWFESRSSIQNIVIQDGVTSIGISAFYDCDSLTDITIPGSVTRIGSSAFYDCDNLTKVQLVEGLETIDADAFGSCDQLGKVTIPSSLKSVSSYRGTFYDCPLLATAGPAGSDCNVEFEALPAYLFYNCTNLTTVEISDSITTIADSAFSNCSSLTSVSIPAGITAIGSCAFSYCSSLTDISIPSSVTSINGSAFSYCNSLTAVSIPEGITNIGSGLFYNCSSLTRISIPVSVASIGGAAFCNCSSLTDVYYTGSETDRTVITIGDDNTELTDAQWHYNSDSDDDAARYEDDHISSADTKKPEPFHGWKSDIPYCSKDYFAANHQKVSFDNKKIINVRKSPDNMNPSYCRDHFSNFYNTVVR